MRIKITKGGIYGAPTAENPTGELAIGTELKVEKAPPGWAGRYVDLDANEPAEGEDVEALKARITELEGVVADRDAEIVKLNAAKTPANDGATTYTVKEQSPGWHAVVDADGKAVTKNLRQDALKDFAGLDAEQQKAFVETNKAD